ncbi:hypothetical protein YPPY89_0944, partial [Yersinia pestis PY-89]
MRRRNRPHWPLLYGEYWLFFF